MGYGGASNYYAEAHLYQAQAESLELFGQDSGGSRFLERESRRAGDGNVPYSKISQDGLLAIWENAADGGMSIAGNAPEMYPGDPPGFKVRDFDAAEQTTTFSVASRSSASLDRGSTLPRDVSEKLAVDVAKADAANGKTLPIHMKDKRWPASDGWVKKQYLVYAGSGKKYNVHYVYNTNTGAAEDFKIKIP
jgi:hypothetical protein